MFIILLICLIFPLSIVSLYSGFSGPHSHVRLISEHFGTILTYVPLILIFIHFFSFFFLVYQMCRVAIMLWLCLKLIICYISSGATNIAEVSSGFHQADWSNTLVIVYCYLISFLFCFICLLFYLYLARNLIVRICRRQVNLNLRYI